MPTAQTRAPPPPLLPTPAATDPSSPAPRHRRHRTFSSSSSSSSSSLSTLSSSAASSPSPSPRGRGATSVPFSWEHHPGIPKTRLAGGFKVASSSSSPPPAPPLPLPPPLRAPPSRAPRHHLLHHHQSRRRRAGSSSSSKPAADAAGDPFAAALAECTRERAAAPGSNADDRRLMDSLFPSPANAPAPPSSASCAPGRRWSAASAGGVAGFLDLYGCKSAMGVAEGAFVVRRPVAVVRPGRGRAGLGLGRAGRR